jgi:hypothetical protein
MTTRSTVDKGLQLGVETTPGTQVAANRKVPNLDIQWNPELQHETFRPPGQKYDTSAVVHGALMRGTYMGAGCFNSIVYALAGLIGATITTPGGGTNSRNWAFVPVASGRDTNQKTYTVERGDAAAAQVSTFTQISSFKLEASRQSVKYNGNVFGRLASDGNTLTASPTLITARPVAAPQIKVYVDTTWAGIGTTLVTDAYAFSLDIGEKFLPFFAFDGSTSYKDTAEQAPDLGFGFKTAHNAQSRAWFGALAANTTYFIRAVITGPILEAAINEKIQIDIAGRFAAAPDDDNGGVYGYEYQFNPIYDSTFNSTGGVLAVNCVNLLTAL